jgi:hypothetical protein
MPRSLPHLSPLVSLSLVLCSSLALAQTAPQLPEPAPGAEHALPDIAAIERGARPRASVSFGRPDVEPSNERGAAEGQPAAGQDNVRRLNGPATEMLGGRTGIYGMESSVPGEISGPIRPATLPEIHVIKNGDTLSSVCEQYFGDPFCWPRLWAENPQVTNPHWIFPGDTVRLRSPTAAAPAPRAASGMRVTSNRRFDSKAVLLRETGFIDNEAFAESARITGSREEKIMLATNDQAYLGFPKNKPLRAGERYSVFVADTANPVRAPDSGAILGYLVRVYGDVTVEQVTEGNVARGTLRDLSEPVERGYAVSPKVRLFKQLEPKPATVNAEARVIASFSPTIMLSAENFVVLSRGSNDGLAVGNRTFVIRRGDGYRPVMEGWQKPDPRFPKEVVAELWVVDVRQNASVAWVARSSKELRIGEVTELRRGH